MADKKEKIPSFQDVLDMVVKDKGGKKEDYIDLLNRIKYHESAHTMDPTIKQYGGGPGRGLYQFEGKDGSNRILSAAVRAKNYFKMKGLDTPEFVSNIINDGTADASELTAEQQDLLAISDLRMKGNLDLKDYADGKLKAEDVWADHWWIGGRDRDKVRDEKINSFRRSSKEYEKNFATEQASKSNIESTKQAMQTMRKSPRFGSLQNDDGTQSTHLMASGNSEGKPIAYPTLFQDDNLNFYKPQDAFQEALAKKEIYDFPTEKAAQKFAKGSWKKAVKNEKELANKKIDNLNVDTEFIKNYMDQNQMTFGGNINNMKNYYDGGGALTEFNVGGTHEQNPLGGIPQGMGANGKMNTVEEGETRAGDYVFSDRIKLDADMIKKYKLPKNLKGKTMAEASKELNKSLKETSSVIDKETTQEMLGRLTAASEDMIQDKPQMNQMFLGGFTDPGMAGAMGIGTGALGLLDTAKGNTSPDATTAGISGAMQGASMGMAAGPLGAIAGGLLGGATGLIGSKKAESEMNKQERESVQGKSASMINSYSGLDPNLLSNFLTNPQGLPQQTLPLMTGNSADLHTNPTRLSQQQANEMQAEGFKEMSPSVTMPKFATPGINSEDNSGIDWGKIGDKAAGALRYAPAVTNAFQLATLRKPEEEKLSRMDKRYNKDLVDEKSLVNQASESYNNAANALTNATNGSVGALRSNLLAAHLNRQKGMGQAFLQADNINRGENRMAQQFDNRNDQINLRQETVEKDWNARNRAAYDNNKSRLISALGQDVGNIGLEELRKKYPERMGLFYDWMGQYMQEQNK